MLSKRTCTKYKEWKKKQKHSKYPKKKIQTVTTDCIEEEKKTKTIIKIQYHKCKKNGEAKKKKRKALFKPKLVSSVDLLFKRIKPSLEVRNQFLDPRHLLCFVETLPKIDLIALKEIAQQERMKMKRKKKRKKKISKKKKAGDREGETKLEGKADEENDETKEERTNGEITENDEKKAKKKKIKKKDKFWCKKFKKKIVYESESSDTECESVCSFDSEICLKGLALTAEDKKKIEENRQRVQSSSNNLD
ncbi:peptidyl-prolyl isomerase cwc27-like [Vespula maculifrons]|uniref:Peptidyl-prolyl isomerase cwc27-like n=1 Tax=Vespula maculifrons TaxID=7453 RepID=A0ABD2D1Y6_VESMC